jgi:DNA-binding NarL/FixJ family response regulator
MGKGMKIRNQPAPKAKATVLVVDDHPLVCEGLAQIINRQKDLSCCGGADSLPALQKAIAARKPDLITIDIRLQWGDGLYLIGFLKTEYPSLPTLVISQCDEALYAERALKAGARGYVMKERATDEVLTAIRTILGGGLYVSPKIAALALSKMIGSRAPGESGGVGNLSNRELQVLQLLGAGLTSRNIAAKLGLSVKTIETHRENIKHKLGISNAVELVRYATNWLEGRGPQS